MRQVVFSQSCVRSLIHRQAGAVAAFTIDLLVYPLDTIKTRYQSQDYIKADPKSAAHKPLALRGLYQGIGSVILATVPAGKRHSQSSFGLRSSD